MRKEEKLIKMYGFISTVLSSGDLLHSIVTTVNKNVYFKIAERDFKCSYHKKMVSYVRHWIC
jgi:hypothetical protein